MSAAGYRAAQAPKAPPAPGGPRSRLGRAPFGSTRPRSVLRTLEEANRFDQVIRLGVDVDLGGGQEFVAGQVLNPAGAGTLFDQPGGKGMPERVRCDPDVKTSQFSVFLDTTLDLAGR